MNTDAPEDRFARWMRDYIDIVRHVVNAFAGGHDRHDLMQEVTLALWRAAPAFLGGSKPSTFVYRVAHNAALAAGVHRLQHEKHALASAEQALGEEPLLQVTQFSPAGPQFDSASARYSRTPDSYIAGSVVAAYVDRVDLPTPG